MKKTPQEVASFLQGKRFAVAGVSRDPAQAANAIFRKLRDTGYEVVPVNPKASELEGVPCYPDVLSVPGSIDGVVVATHPRTAVEVVRHCADRQVKHIWFHRSFGQGSVSKEAIEECKTRGIQCIIGGCPLMYCEPVDFGHRCIRSWLRFSGRVPG
jgi:predicted CoA-binding protein